MAETRGRRSRNVEFFTKLFELAELTTADFAYWCGKRYQNVVSYLAGTKVPGNRVLWSALENFFEWDVYPLLELEPLPRNLNTLPTESGIYVFYDSAGNVLYIGQATNLRNEVRQTLGRQVPEAIRFGPSLRKQRPQLRTVTSHLSLYQVDSARVRHNLEALLLRIHPNQAHNLNIGTFK